MKRIVFDPLLQTYRYTDYALGVDVTIPHFNTFADLPSANLHVGKVYYVTTATGTWWLPSSLGGTYYPKGLYYSDGISWETTPTPWASTQSQVDNDENDDTFVTPRTLNAFSKWGTKENSANKTGTIIGNESSTTLFAHVKAMVDWVTSLFVPKSRTITINGDTKDLSTDRNWTISAGVWGSIAGTLSNQTDLYNALMSEVLTVDFMTGLVIEIYAPNNLKINSISNVVNTPTTTILVGGSPYVLGNTITTGSLIRISVSTYSVVNLNILNL